MDVKRLSYKHKNNKFLYYAKNYLRQIIPSAYYQTKLNAKLKSIKLLDDGCIERLMFRVNYYNKLETFAGLSVDVKKLSDLKIRDGLKTYYFDLYEYSRFFNQDLKGNFLFGDITTIPDEPSLVKSRPVCEQNANSVLLKWNKARHFMYVNKEKRSFLQKKNLLVWRGNVQANQPNRIQFLDKFFGHPLCDVGKVNKNNLNSNWDVGRMTIDEQLEFKFILSLEGNDVASNLKWIMSSNSLAVMSKPKFETWFMEGLLIPDYHYVLIKDDYSDLESKLEYYINNPEKAVNIIKNAKEYVMQFKDKRMERLISLMVLEKYFEKTNQIKPNA